MSVTLSDFLIKEPFLFDDIENYDYLDTKNKVEKFIKNIDNINNGTIGLVSKAGSGKSFFLKILYDELKSNQKNVIYMDISNYQEIDDIFLLLMSVILSEIDNNKDTKDSLNFIKNYLSGILNSLDDSSKIKQSYKILKALLDVGNTSFLYKNLQKDKIDDFLKKYNEYLKEKQYVLIIDNLEKCSPEYVVKFFLFTRKIINNNILIILSYDKSEIENALKSFYGNDFDTQSFFRKFILLEFYIEKYYDKIENLIDNILPKDFDFENVCERENFLKIFEEIYKEKKFKLSLRLLIMIIHKLVFFKELVFFKDQMKVNDIKYFLILIIYKFICEKGYEKLYYAYQYGNINKDLDFLSKNEKEKFESVINTINLIVEIGNKEVSYEDLVKIFEIIEL